MSQNSSDFLSRSFTSLNVDNLGQTRLLVASSNRALNNVKKDKGSTGERVVSFNEKSSCLVPRSVSNAVCTDYQLHNSALQHGLEVWW